jgi:hypothetical protein
MNSLLDDALSISPVMLIYLFIFAEHKEQFTVLTCLLQLKAPTQLFFSFRSVIFHTIEYFQLAFATFEQLFSSCFSVLRDVYRDVNVLRCIT